MRPLTIGFACTALVLGACEDDRSSRPETSSTPSATAAPAPPPDPTPDAGRPALCGAVAAQPAGRVSAPGAGELSGLVRSRAKADVLWAHNDSGNRPRLFALRPDGHLLREVEVTGATATDWEDIAATEDELLVADIGDNARQRSQITVDRIAEPDVSDSGPARARPLTLRYPDGAHDAETLLADPSDGGLVIVTKELDGASGIYAAGPAGGVLRRTGSLDLGLLQFVTAGDVSADGRIVALRSYDRLYVWRRRGDEPLPGTLQRKPCSPDVDLSPEGQGETLALTADGGAVDTVPEGDGPLLRRYAPVR